MDKKFLLLFSVIVGLVLFGINKQEKGHNLVTA